MSMLMGGLCHLTAVWLLYRRPYDLVRAARNCSTAGAVVPNEDEAGAQEELSLFAGASCRSAAPSERR